MRTTQAQQLQQKARYAIGATVQVYDIFNGWQTCEVTSLGWDGMYGRVQYHVALSGAATRWITCERYMR